MLVLSAQLETRAGRERAVVNRPSNSFGFVRFALASLVIYSHAFQLSGQGEDHILRWSGGTISAGTVAVHGFFALSGFLITQSWCRLRSLPRFLWHRALRIFPGLWGCLALTAFGFAWLVHRFPGSSDAAFLGLDPGPIRYLFSNLLYPRNQFVIGNLLTQNPFSPDWNGPLWTLTYEIACYAFVGLLGVLGFLTSRRSAGLTLLLTPIVIFVILRLNSYDTLPSTAAKLVYGINREMCLHFLAGAVCAIWLGQRDLSAFRLPVGLGAAALLVLLWTTRYHQSLSPLLMPLVVLSLAAALPFGEWERRLGGDYSYGLYIYGWPIQQVLVHFGLHRLGGPEGFFALSLAVALLFAAVSWHLLERPALAQKDLLKQRSDLPPSSAHA